MRFILLLLLRLYQLIISPILHLIAPGSGCRFYPTCSAYAIEAVQIHGPVKGLWLTVKRLSRCHPWGGHGFDPVPQGCSCTAEPDVQHPVDSDTTSSNGTSVQSHKSSSNG